MSSLLAPTVVQRTGNSERAFDIYSRLLEERIVFLGTAIDDAAANLVIAQLLHLESDSAEKDIHLYINSPGGSITAGLGQPRERVAADIERDYILRSEDAVEYGLVDGLIIHRDSPPVEAAIR